MDQLNFTDSVIQPWIEGSNVIFLDCDLSDHSVYNRDVIRSREDIFREQILERYGFVLLKYSLAAGLRYDKNGLTSSEIRNIDRILRETKIQQTNTNNSMSQINIVLSGIFQLNKLREQIYFDNRKPLRFCFLIEYGNHLFPHVQTGMHEQEQLKSLELIDMLSKSLDLRNQAHYIIINGDDTLEHSVRARLPERKINYPGEQEKPVFFDACISIYNNATIEDSASKELICLLSKNTPNRSMEKLFRGSHKTGKQITIKQIREIREEDIKKISEGTLSTVRTDRLRNNLVGRNIQKPIAILRLIGEGIRNGDPNTPSNILLVGPKSSGKSDLAIQMAAMSDIPAFRLNSPKNMYVGETERLCRKMFDVLYDQGQSIGFIDELELQFPMDRNQNFGDSGASNSIIGILQETLADRSRNGKNILLATSNDPQMGASMKERFDLIIPVLMPLKEDLSLIVVELAKTINSELVIEPNDEKVAEAANIFYQKRATPRSILAGFKRAVIMNNRKLTLDVILWTAQVMRIQVDFDTALYSELVAIKLSGDDMLPWFEDPNYPYPDYLTGIIESDNVVNHLKLEQEIEKLKLYAKI